MLNHRLVLVFVLLTAFIISFAQSGLTAVWPGVDPEDAANIMPVSQIKRGMRGYGLTVFQGTTIEKFDVEVLGVMKQAVLDKELILIRASGGPITARRTGIIAGMSGSPVYIDGKLIGAIGYGLQYPKEPLGMVTPITAMLEAWDDNLPKSASGYSSPDPERWSLSEPVTVDGTPITDVCIDHAAAAGQSVQNGVLYMRPLMMPLMVSGVSPRGMATLAEILRPFNLQPVAGPGGGPVAGADPELLPGAAVGMSLASGDIDMSGIGTVSYRRGDRVLAFAHPMLGVGAIDAPLTTAYVTDVLPLYTTTTKVASPIKTVGRVFQDRPWSVAGRVGEMPRTIPVTVEVDDLSTGRKRTCRTDVIDHPLLASRIAAMVVSESIYQVHPVPGDATAEVDYEVVADQVGKITRSNVFFDSAAIESAAPTDVATLLMLLNGNRFYPLDVKSVNVKVRIAGKRQTATVDRIFVRKTEFEPGETVDVGVVLRPYKGDRITRNCTIQIPATAADGKVALVVRGGGQTVSVDSQPRDGDSGSSSPTVVSGLGGADNVKQLIEKFVDREKNNDIVVQLFLRSTAVNVRGEKLTGLPDPIADIMKSSRSSGVRVERDETKEVFPEDMIIEGAAQLTIEVKKKSVNESKPAAGSENAPKPGEARTASSGALFADASWDSAAAGSPAGAFDDLATLMAVSDEEPSVTVTEEITEEEKIEDDAAEEPSSKESDAPAAKPPAGDTSSGVKTVARQVKTWAQKTQADFAKGVFAGVAASSDGKLRLVPMVNKLAETPEQFAWCLAPGADGVYAGTGSGGKIYHVANSGALNLFYDTGELQVHSLVRDSAGNLFAGTSPNGRVYRISPDGQGKVVLDADERYVLALAIGADEAVYAGVGDAGKVYRIASDGTASLFAEIGEQQVLSLHCTSDGALLIGTGINGVMYKMEPNALPRPMFDAAESSITSLVSDSKGNIYAGTSSKGVVYRITPDGRSKAVYTGAARVLSMVVDSRDSVYAVSDSAIARIDPDDTIVALDSTKEKAQFLSLLLNEADDSLYAATGNIGAIYRVDISDAAGSFESPVHDCGAVSRWGRIKWMADSPEGAGVELQTRVGNVATPDSTWSMWSAPYISQSGEEISNPSARYIQYRVNLKSQNPQSSPTVSVVSVSYLTPNQPPTVKLTAPAAGDIWAGKQTIKWQGSDPDNDTLTYDIYYSTDGGKDWTALVGGMSGVTAGALSEEQVVSKIKSELDKSADIPADMKDAVVQDPQGLPPQRPNARPAAEAKSSTSTSYAWDTDKVKDGVYLLKVIASDKTSNAADALSQEVVSEPFLVCNSAPQLRLYKRAIQLAGPGPATVSGSAQSELVDVAGVQYRVDGGDWMAAAADDGMFDSPYEIFTVTTEPLKAGNHKLEIQAVDSAGNASSATMEIRVEAP